MIAKYHGIKSLSEIYAKKHKTTFKVAEQRVKEMIDLLEEGLLDENYDGIQFVDSITMRKVTRKASLGRNMRTGAKIEIPERLGIKTQLGKKLYTKLEN